MRRAYTDLPDIGSVINGTHRPEDLIPAFVAELESRLPSVDDGNHADLIRRCNGFDFEDPEETDELIAELFDALGEIAPPYTYFGAHPGDGADFGFWPNMHEIEELPAVADPGDVDALGEPCRFVNDHGNVTVYDFRLVPVLELV